MTCPETLTDGAYVLGALSPAERAQFEYHLAGCPTCDTAVRRLAPLPGLLSRVDAALLEEVRPQSFRLPRLLGALTTARRRHLRSHRWRLALAALAAAAAAAGGTAVWLEPAPVQPAPVAHEMSAVAAASPVTAEVGMSAAPGGTMIWMRCYYLAGYDEPAHTFRLVAMGADGSREQVGSWWAGPGDEVELTGLTRFAGADLVRLELQDARGTALLALDT